jgi:hypothetical protein
VTTIPQPWITRAEELALWTDNRLVNRVDAWGAYRPDEEIGREYVGSNGNTYRLGEQKTVKGLLTRAELIRHYQARNRAAIIGLHSADRDNLSKSGALDIDWHGPTSTAPEINLRAALGWYLALTRNGFHPLLTESNGRGGYHLRVLLSEGVPAGRVFYFLKNLTADHKQLGFAKRPEQFPKQPDVRRCKKQLGNWLRLPGRHHKRDFWSRVWDGSRWLDGNDAIDFILYLSGDQASWVPEVPASMPPSGELRRHVIVYHPDNFSLRIDAYLRKLPNAGEGQGRDDIAFSFACWLVRDMSLSDATALGWLRRWDAGNRPPKGEGRLKEIIANAHEYGRNAYGCGRDHYIVRGRRPGHYSLHFQVEV